MDNSDSEFDEKIKELFAKRMNRTAIGKEIGISEHRVRTRIKALGLRQRAPHTKEFDKQVLELKDSGKTRDEIGDIVGLKRWQVDKIIDRSDTLLSKEQRSSLSSRINGKRATPIPVGTEEAVISLYKKTTKAKEIAVQLGIPINKVNTIIRANPNERRTAEQLSEVHRVYSQEIKDQAKMLRAEGVSLKYIAERLNLKEGALSYLFNQDGVLLADEFKGQHNRIHSRETEDKIVELRLQKMKRKDIATTLNIKPSKVKTHLGQKAITLPERDYEAELREVAAIDKYEILSPYVDSSTKMSFKCPKGHLFEMNANTFKKGHRCRKCYVLSRTNVANPATAKYFWQDVLDVCKINEVVFLNCPEPNEKVSFGTNKDHRWKFQCHCKNIFYPRISDFLRGKYNSCGCVKSKEPRKIMQWLESKGHKVNWNDTTTLGVEIDLYLQKERFGIEYCGTYFHGERLNKQDARLDHIRKWNLCELAGIRLITLFEDEWIHGKEKVLGYLSSILGHNEVKVGARRCEVQEVNPVDSAAFLNANHIQGAVRGHGLGLFYNNELVSLITTRAPTKSRIPKGFDSTNCLDITRFCNKIGVTIMGGFSKLLSALIAKTPQLRCLITYSDNRWSRGRTYEENGFIMSNKPPQPTYSYFRAGTQGPRFHRFKFRKDNLAKLFPNVDIKQTEWQIMKKNKYDRIWDCGTIKWIKVIK